MQPTILPHRGVRPRIHRSAWIAPGATIIGDVSIGPGASVYPGCVLRGDGGPISIGARSNVQDNSVMHADPDAPVRIGREVTVGHMALVHGARIHDSVLIGMHATVLNHAVVESRSIIAAGAVVLENRVIPAGSLAAGVPARVVREDMDLPADFFSRRAERYVELSAAQADHEDALRLDEVRVDDVRVDDDPSS